MSDRKTVTLAELRAHCTKTSMYTLIHGKVYNVTEFLDEHPGGDEVIIAEAGKDASDAFDDVGHSDEAVEMLVDMLVGVYEEERKDTKDAASAPVPQTPSSQGGFNLLYLAPLAVLAGWLAYRYFSTRTLH
ncbi:cytochrome b5-like heme/steroid binding domain-containing protein [Favolaschia claudopus]|uniref:Cytochrome b5-like heme/steroid binding domain-containing protein n=1 Tax=Favolaschia claudopus TaxID=2862362 RepID=A0AAW0EBB2_9AGAR